MLKNPTETEATIEPYLPRYLRLIEEHHDPRSPAQIAFDKAKIEREECARLYAETQKEAENWYLAYGLMFFCAALFFICQTS